MSIHLTIFGKPRYLGLLELEAPFPPQGTWLVVETMRGAEIALLGGPLSADQEARYRASCSDDASDGQVKGGEPILQEIAFARLASEEDLDAAARQRDEENDVLVKARRLLRNHNLSMKLVDVEYLLDKKKLFFYFTSEQRVDFRAFVRDLAKEFKTRIELRQIGVRDEAKTVKGLAPCGRECCCSHWLHRFTPICIKMVKEQNLALNPTKISGICGRLMCCMSYEYSSYNILWKNLPNPGAKIRTASGNFLVDGVELSAEAVRIRRPDGGSILVPVEDFARFKDTVMEGGEWEDPSASKSSGRALPDHSASRSGRPFTETPLRPSGKKPGESPGRGRNLGPGVERKKIETEEKIGAEKEKIEKRIVVPEAVPEGTPAKGNKKKRRRKKPSSSLAGAASQSPMHPETGRQPETKQSSGEHSPRKQVPSGKTSETKASEKTEKEPGNSGKEGESQRKRSSSSRRRRSGSGAKKKPQEGQQSQPETPKKSHQGETRPLEVSQQQQQRRQKPRPQN